MTQISGAVKKNYAIIWTAAGFLATGVPGYRQVVDICTSSQCALVVVGCLPEKPRWCLIEQVCRGSKV